MKLAIVQFKPRKGEAEANLTALGDVFAQLAAEEKPYDLIVFPEAALTGYFLEGAVYELAFSTNTLAERLARLWRERAPVKRLKPVDVAIGFYENDGGTYHNSAMYLHVTPERHEVVHVHRKMFLPTYGVFDEERFLSRGRRLQAFDTRFGRMALLICEDMWHALMPTIAAIKGARALIVPSASPGRGIEGRDGELESVRYWHELLHATAVEHGVFIFYAGLAGFEGVRGRLEPVDLGQDFRVLIDFAHSSGALASALAELRLFTPGRLITVFGSTARSNHDRPGMGRAAAEFADFFIITTDDPLAEDPVEIAREVQSGAEGKAPGRDYEIVIDRRAAIRRAIDIARTGDVVLLAGKGHEHTMRTALGAEPWDERAEAEAAIREKLRLTQ